MRERTSRYLFTAELVVFALPSIAFLVIYAAMIGSWSLFAIFSMLTSEFSSLPNTAKGVRSTLQTVALLGGVAAAATAGLAAIGIFMRIAKDFVRHGRDALAGTRSVFYRGLLWAIVPLLVMIIFAWNTVLLRQPAGAVVGFYLSGLALSVPVLHLWLELRLSGRAVHAAD